MYIVIFIFYSKNDVYTEFKLPVFYLDKYLFIYDPKNVMQFTNRLGRYKFKVFFHVFRVRKFVVDDDYNNITVVLQR